MANHFPLVYGAMYVPQGTVITVTISNNTDYFVIPATWTTGLVRGVTFTNNNGLTVLYTGKYLIQADLSVTCASTNQDMQLSVFEGSTQFDPATGRMYLITNNQYYNVNACGIASLTAGNEITVRIRNNTGATNLSIRNAQFNIIRVG